MFSNYSEAAGGMAEPMTLGSPAGSPVNANLSFSHQGPQFLPGFLMGEAGPSTATSPRIWPGSVSPNKHRPSSWIGASQGTPSSPTKSLVSPAASSTRRNYNRQPSTEKHGGPPVQGLFDHMSTPTSSHHPAAFNQMPCTPASIPSRPNHFISTPIPNADKFFTPTKTYKPDINVPSSPAQIDPFYTQGESLKSGDELDETWITVFGFPPTAASYILQQFYHYGSIVDHKMSPNGNWMHIHYTTKLQAKIALSKNGRIFSGNIMVGVAPCIEKAIMNGRLNSGNKSTSRPSLTCKPANAPYSPASTEHSIIRNNQIPQKSTGLMSKTLEYFFGW